MKFSWLIIIVTFLYSKSMIAYENNEFPMIMYAVPASDSNFKEVKSLGINYVHMYALTSGTLTKKKLTEIESYLDLAQKHNLKVLFDLNGLDRVPKGKIDEIEVLVKKFKNHPAIGYWYLFDEPDNKKISAKQLKPYYDLIKKESPDIPIAICHGWTKNWNTYSNVQDVLLHDIYPVLGEKFPNSKLNSQTVFTHAAIKQRKNNKIIPVIQFFNWKSMISSDKEVIKGYTAKELRYPNYEEFRYLCLSTIAQGVNGISFYSFARNKMISSKWSGEVAAPIMNEAKELMDIVNKNKLVFKNITEQSKSSEYLYSYWEGDNEKYLIIANRTNRQINVTLSDKKLLLNKNIKPWGNTRNIHIKKNTNQLVIEKLKPWEVIILKSEF